MNISKWVSYKKRKRNHSFWNLSKVFHSQCHMSHKTSCYVLGVICRNPAPLSPVQKSDSQWVGPGNYVSQTQLLGTFWKLIILCQDANMRGQGGGRIGSACGRTAASILKSLVALTFASPPAESLAAVSCPLGGSDNVLPLNHKVGSSTLES